MPETIAEAYVQIKPSMEGISSELESAMGSAGSSGAKSFGSGFSSALSGLGKVGAVAVGAATAATGALVGNIVSATSSVAEYGDNIDKMSQKMGISATAYQEWEAVMQHSGTSMETLKASMKTMASAAESGNEAFERLGISEEEVASLSQEDLFSKVIAGLQDMGEGTERTYLAGQLLGRGATELGALLNTSAEDTEAMKQRVHELGGVMSDEAVSAAAGFQDSLQDMQTALSGITRGLMGEFLPSITNVMDGLANIFSGDKDLGLEQMQAGIDEFITNLTAKLPEMLDIGLGILEAIATSIVNNLPTVISTGLDIILSLAQGIIENLPQIIPAVVDVILEMVDVLTQPDTLVNLINAALQLMIALAEGLIKALPQLIAKAPEIIMNLAQALIQALPMILEAAIQLIATLIQGIVSCFSQIIETGKNIVAQVKDGLMQKIEEAKTWGKDMIQNFIDGIKSKISAVKDAIGGIAKSIKDFLGFSEPDMGPLSNFHTYAPDMLKLFASGIRENVGLVTSAVDAMANGISGEMAVNANVTGRTSSGLASYEIAPQMAMAGAAAGGDVVIPVYIGNERIDEIVVKANQRANYRSGGR